MKSKFTSRKFILSLAAFLNSVAVSISGLSTGNTKVVVFGVVCSIISAGLYAACEAWVDAAHCNDIAIEEEEGDPE